MKNVKNSLAAFAKQITEYGDGKIDGGFSIITPSNNDLIIGGTDEPSNNCNGGNCVQGCGTTNHYAGCGGVINFTPGCGT